MDHSENLEVMYFPASDELRVNTQPVQTDNMSMLAQTESPSSHYPEATGLEIVGLFGGLSLVGVALFAASRIGHEPKYFRGLRARVKQHLGMED
jgi:hypothetical protein